MNNPEGIVIPIAVFTAMLIFVGILLMYSLSKKRLFLKFIGQHDDLSPDSIKAIGKVLFSANNDMRKGVFSLLLAVAIWGFSFMADFPQNGNLDLNDAIFGLGLFPFCGGIAYLILTFVERK